MKRWPIKTLRELVDFIGGGTPRRDHPEYWGGDIPWASVKDLQGILLEGTLEKITKEGLDNSAAHLIPAGTVIIASRVGLGKVTLNKIPVAINQDLKALTPKANNLLPRYLLYSLLSKTDMLEKAGVGATVKGLNISDYQRISIVLPPQAEQERIVKILDEADELRKLRAQAGRRASDLIPALFYEMFGDAEQNPKSWIKKTIGDIASHERFAIRMGPFGSQLKKHELVDEGVKVLWIENVVKGFFEWADNKCITYEKYQQLKGFSVKPQDILITTMGTVGISCVVPENIGIAIISSHLIKITLDNTVASPIFISEIVNSGYAARYFKVFGHGAIMKGLNTTIVKGLPIPIPPLSIQQEFAKRVCEIRELEAGQAASHRQLEELFQSLLYAAFQGNL